MYLKQLIEWLEKQDPEAVVKDGFGSPHSDRGHYENLGFNPVEETTFGAMLENARSALGATFEGYKGGDYTMHEYTDCFIGRYSECGESVTSAHMQLWHLTATNPGQSKRKAKGKHDMNLMELIEDGLKRHGYDGLFYESQCACKIGDIYPCGGEINGCEPGVFVDGPCDSCCGGAPCDFHIGKKD